MIRLCLLLAFVILHSSFVTAQTVGQYELRKRGASGYTSYGITLSNGQVIGQTAGVPAAITPLVSGDLSAYLTTATAATTYQPLSSTLTTLSSATAAGLALMDDANAAAQRTTLGLGNVEDTALSTWSGSNTITTLGTITAGTWNGTAIGLGYIAQGGATSGQVLTWNGTNWAPAAGGGGITIGTTTITGGTSGRILGNVAGVVGELTTTGSGNVVLSNAPVFSALSTTYITAVAQSTTNFDCGIDQPYAFTFGTFAGRCLAIGVNLGGSTGNGISLRATYGVHWASTADTRDAIDLSLYRHAAGSMMQRFGTTAQALFVANTYASSTSYEAAVFDWKTTANTLLIGSAVGSGGGTARDVKFIRGGVVKQSLGANTTDHSQPVKAAVYTVATLPAAATVGAYSIAAVSDATAPVIGTAVAGGGSAKALVCSNGTDWIVIATL